MILDHIVAQDVRGHEIPDIPYNPILDLDLRRDSAPAARRACKDVVTTYLPTMLPPPMLLVQVRVYSYRTRFGRATVYLR